jgi:Protein of unknown function (DUF1326)
MTSKLSIILILISFFGCEQKSETSKSKWSIKATYYESCSCNAPCPCPFGLPMTNSFCKLNSLLEIHEGQFNDIDLKGIRVVTTGSSGDWGEFNFSETTTDKQKSSIESILKIVNIYGFDTILTSKKTKIDFEKKEGNVAYSTPTVNVVMSMIKGKNGEPIVIKNLSKKVFENYVPYLSYKNVRLCSDTTHNFSFEKKAGFTSEWNLTDEDFN